VLDPRPAAHLARRRPVIYARSIGDDFPAAKLNGSSSPASQRRSSGRSLYILDERRPDFTDDIKQSWSCSTVNRFGNTMIIVEHNLT
jgi:hypothetical protein